MTAQHDELKTVFASALERRSPSDREAYLDEACAGNAELRPQVEALLQAHDLAGSFLESPPAGDMATIAQPLTEKPGALIGRYKLLEEIGEGAMGVVYMAEQREPVRRKVALKIIKPGMDTREVIARFEAERQALAMMDHPNIAKVLDGGTTEESSRHTPCAVAEDSSRHAPRAVAEDSSRHAPRAVAEDSSRHAPRAVADDGTRSVPTTFGRPYFVMELVQGFPITEYCDRANLTTRQRLELFVLVCQAVHHAHQKGIIHRDIKPSNVMVTLHDGVPVPKIIDFGIAKAINQQLTEKTLFTGHGRMLGTPLYMSPEQAEMSGLDVDTRSDIYSLGVLLYELLTGSTPFGKERLREAGLDEIRRVIREEEPPRPSVRIRMLRGKGDTAKKGTGPICAEHPEGRVGKLDLSPFSPSAQKGTVPVSATLGAEAMSTVTAHRGVDARRLGRLLRGDLDWIVMKALEKDRARRYVSASAFAADVERHLANEPIEARPPTLADRAGKWARRHRPVVWAAASLLVLATIGSTVSALLIGQAYEEKNQQLAATERAEQLAREQEGLAKQQQEAAKKQAALAREQHQVAVRQRDLSEGNLYVAHMRLAQHDWDAGQISRLHAMLDSHVPEPGRPDMRGWEWYYLLSLCHSDLMTLRGHTAAVNSVAWSPDGNRVASGDFDGMIKIWDVATGNEILTLSTHYRNHIEFLTWSPDGKRLMSESNDKCVRIWDAATGKEIDIVHGRNLGVAWGPDGQCLVATVSSESGGGDPQTVRVWDRTRGRQIIDFKCEGDSVRAWVWSPDGKRLAARTHDRMHVKIWDAITGEELLSLSPIAEEIYTIAWSPDGKRLVSGGIANWAQVWDTGTGQEVLRLQHRSSVTTVAWSPDGRCLATASYDQMIRVWDPASGKEILTLRGHRGSSRSVTWSPDGAHLASAGDDNTVKIWDARKRRDVVVVDRAGATSLAWSPTGNRLASVGRRMQLWEARTGREILSLDVPAQLVAWSPDGDRLAAYRGDRTVILDSATCKELAVLQGDSVTGLSWSADGTHLALARPQTVDIWQTSTRKKVLSRPHSTGLWASAAAFSPAGTRVASTGMGAVTIWDAATGKDFISWRAHTMSEIRAVAWSPDGTKLASGGHDQAVKVWDALDGRELLRLVGHNGSIYVLHWSPDGRRLVSGSSDGTIKVWDPATGQDLFSLPGSWLTWSPDGQRLATLGDPDGTIRIYDASAGYTLASTGGSEPARSLAIPEKPSPAKDKPQAK